MARDSQHSPAGFLSETAPTQGGGGGGGASEKCHSQTGGSLFGFHGEFAFLGG